MRHMGELRLNRRLRKAGKQKPVTKGLARCSEINTEHRLAMRKGSKRAAFKASLQVKSQTRHDKAPD